MLFRESTRSIDVTVDCPHFPIHEDVVAVHIHGGIHGEGQGVVGHVSKSDGDFGSHT